MTAQDYDLATTADMIFDELIQDMHIFPDDSPTMAKVSHKCIARCDSASSDDQQACVPSLAPISPCLSERSSSSGVSAAMSITGKFSNIENKYQVDPRVIGTGHHGSVRECVNRATGQRYAVKSICKSDQAVKRRGLAREIMLLRDMKHHSIVQLVDVFEDADYVHIVTDLYTGGELFDKIAEKSSNYDDGAPCFAEDEAARIMNQILKSVSYLHKHGIAHRDIKPENILFETKDEDSPIKIIDFGLARKHYGEFGDTPMSTIVGTPYYIAPDVLRKKGYDKSCDLWSVGVIAYILLSGYPPFNGNDDSEVYDAVQRGWCQFPSADWSGTSRESRNFIRRLLQTDPRKRMTVDQALKHPWIVKNVKSDMVPIEEDRRDISSVEVVFHGSPQRDAIIYGDTNKDEVRTALFASRQSKWTNPAA